MKTLGEAALDLPWIAPSVASLTTLARLPFASAWHQLRTDPGIVLLAARLLDPPAKNASASEQHEIPLLESLLQFLPHLETGFVDWNQAGPNTVYRACYQHASLATRLAAKIDGGKLANPADDRVWMAGFLAPLGWLAVTAVDPLRVGNYLAANAHHHDSARWQQKTWGLDQTAIARRLARAWRLPAWLSVILGHLGLHVSIAERLGAPSDLFQIMQLTALLLQQREPGFTLSVGATLPDLLASLRLNAEDANALADSVRRAEIPNQTWESPAKQTLLPDFLRLSLENRRRNDAAWVERLQQDIDRMQEALVKQCTDDQLRLQAMKLSALAEFAGGAGHEINNPLAVISGQAQYVLKQLDWLDGPAEEIENIGEYLDNLRSMITPALKKVIGQTQRIHSILTELMQFARPGTPRLQAVSVSRLVREVTEMLQAFAQEHRVTLNSAEPTHDMWIQADPAQARVALASLLKNAIEAAPTDGYANLRAENTRAGILDLIVEDNGPGPPTTGREHLFDPFYSGRSAGRGRGMGLPTAWRLARQQDGDVRFDGVQQGVTRFVLSLPMAAAPGTANGNGRNGAHVTAPAHR